MIKGGRSTQGGIYAQNWAAMSLFLQFVQQKDLIYIGFEGEKLEDFHLVFSDGRKMVCESKNQVLNYADIKAILEKISKHGQINKNDQIVIICKSVNSGAKSDIENYKYFKDRIDTVLSSKPHNFSLRHLKIRTPTIHQSVLSTHADYKVKRAQVAPMGRKSGFFFFR